MEPTSAAARWAIIVEESESSGLTAREYADAHDLNPRILEWLKAGTPSVDNVDVLRLRSGAVVRTLHDRAAGRLPGLWRQPARAPHLLVHR